MSHQQIIFTDGTASSPAIGPQDGCLGQIEVSVVPTKIDCREVLRKMPSIAVQQGQESTIRHVMRSTDGNPVDLTDCQANTVKLRLREALGISDTILEMSGTIVDAAAGVVEAELTEGAVALAGIVVAEFAILNGDDKLVFSNQFWLTVNYGLFNDEATTGKARKGPPTMSEIRLHLRDSDPAENSLLDAQEFDGSDIAACISRVVTFWNEVPPPIRTYTTQTFPYRYLWLDGIVAGLMSLASLRDMRNNLRYVAGGISVDDQGGYRDYSAEGQRLWAETKRAIMQKKASLNAALGYGTVSSAYGRSG